MEVGNWVEMRLGDLIQQEKARLQTGPFGTVLNASEYEVNGRPVISVGEIQGGRVVLHPRTPNVGETTAARLSKYLLESGDIVFGRKGGVERTAWITPEQHGYFLGSDAISLRFLGDLNSRFFSYVFRSESAKEWLLQHAGGSTMPSMNEKILHRFPFLLPPPKTQDSIVRVLSPLDDKIELNRKMNRTLEELTQGLFRSWFVDFDPVVAKREGRRPVGVPDAVLPLFPEHFEESEAGSIPQGWKVSTIGAEVTVVGGSTPRTDESSFWGGDIHWITPRDLSKLSDPVVLRSDRTITAKGLAEISSGLLPPKAVLLSSRAPIGYLAIAEIPLAINQGFIGMICDKEISPHFALNWTRQAMEEILSRAGGTTFAEISKANFRPIPIVKPPQPLITAFDEHAGPWFEQLVSNVRENSLLANLRDTLLDPLLSGELSLADAERAMATVL